MQLLQEKTNNRCSRIHTVLIRYSRGIGLPPKIVYPSADCPPCFRACCSSYGMAFRIQLLLDRRSSTFLALLCLCIVPTLRKQRICLLWPHLLDSFSCVLPASWPIMAPPWTVSQSILARFEPLFAEAKSKPATQFSKGNSAIPYIRSFSVSTSALLRHFRWFLPQNLHLIRMSRPPPPLGNMRTTSGGPTCYII